MKKSNKVYVSEISRPNSEPTLLGRVKNFLTPFCTPFLSIASYYGYQTSKNARNKVYDTFTLNSVTSSGSIGLVTPIPQGVGVGQRIGDTVFIKDIVITLDCVLENSDVYDTIRFILFRYLPNTALGAPTVATILQFLRPTSNHAWETSSQFQPLLDVTFAMAGTSTAPCSSGHQFLQGVVPMANIPKMIEFTAAATTASGHIFWATISNSVVAPFGVLAIETRVIFSEQKD